MDIIVEWSPEILRIVTLVVLYLRQNVDQGKRKIEESTIDDKVVKTNLFAHQWSLRKLLPLGLQHKQL